MHNQANLKYQGNTYTEDESCLLYVEFDFHGVPLRWYPKWQEVIDIIRAAYVTEECCHNGKQSKKLERCLHDLISSKNQKHPPPIPPF